MASFSLDDRRVQMPADGQAWIAPNAIVVGNVILETDASVWFSRSNRTRNGRPNTTSAACTSAATSDSDPTPTQHDVLPHSWLELDAALTTTATKWSTTAKCGHAKASKK